MKIFAAIALFIFLSISASGQQMDSRMLNSMQAGEDLQMSADIRQLSLALKLAGTAIVGATYIDYNSQSEDTKRRLIGPRAFGILVVGLTIPLDFAANSKMKRAGEKLSAR